MTYSDDDAREAIAALSKYQGADGEVGAALAVVGLSSARAAKEVGLRDDMIRVAHRCGASVRQIADVSGLGRKTVAAIVDPATSAER